MSSFQRRNSKNGSASSSVSSVPVTSKMPQNVGRINALGRQPQNVGLSRKYSSSETQHPTLEKCCKIFEMLRTENCPSYEQNYGREVSNLENEVMPSLNRMLSSKSQFNATRAFSTSECLEPEYVFTNSAIGKPLGNSPQQFHFSRSPNDEDATPRFREEALNRRSCTSGRLSNMSMPSFSNSPRCSQPPQGLSGNIRDLLDSIEHESKTQRLLDASYNEVKQRLQDSLNGIKKQELKRKTHSHRQSLELQGSKKQELEATANPHLSERNRTSSPRNCRDDYYEDLDTFVSQYGTSVQNVDLVSDIEIPKISRVRETEKITSTRIIGSNDNFVREVVIEKSRIDDCGIEKSEKQIIATRDKGGRVIKNTKEFVSYEKSSSGSAPLNISLNVPTFIPNPQHQSPKASISLNQGAVREGDFRRQPNFAPQNNIYPEVQAANSPNREVFHGRARSVINCDIIEPPPRTTECLDNQTMSEPFMEEYHIPVTISTRIEEDRCPDYGLRPSWPHPSPTLTERCFSTQPSDIHVSDQVFIPTDRTHYQAGQLRMSSNGNVIESNYAHPDLKTQLRSLPIQRSAQLTMPSGDKYAFSQKNYESTEHLFTSTPNPSGLAIPYYTQDVQDAGCFENNDAISYSVSPSFGGATQRQSNQKNVTSAGMRNNENYRGTQQSVFKECPSMVQNQTQEPYERNNVPNAFTSYPIKPEGRVTARRREDNFNNRQCSESEILPPFSQKYSQVQKPYEQQRSKQCSQLWNQNQVFEAVQNTAMSRSAPHTMPTEYKSISCLEDVTMPLHPQNSSTVPNCFDYTNSSSLRALVNDDNYSGGKQSVAMTGNRDSINSCSCKQKCAEESNASSPELLIDESFPTLEKTFISHSNIANESAPPYVENSTTESPRLSQERPTFKDLLEKTSLPSGCDVTPAIHNIDVSKILYQSMIDSRKLMDASNRNAQCICRPICIPIPFCATNVKYPGSNDSTNQATLLEADLQNVKAKIEKKGTSVDNIVSQDSEHLPDEPPVLGTTRKHESNDQYEEIGSQISRNSRTSIISSPCALLKSNYSMQAVSSSRNFPSVCLSNETEPSVFESYNGATHREMFNDECVPSELPSITGCENIQWASSLGNNTDSNKIVDNSTLTPFKLRNAEEPVLTSEHAESVLPDNALNGVNGTPQFESSTSCEYSDLPIIPLTSTKYEQCVETTADYGPPIASCKQKITYIDCLAITRTLRTGDNLCKETVMKPTIEGHGHESVTVTKRKSEKDSANTESNVSNVSDAENATSLNEKTLAAQELDETKCQEGNKQSDESTRLSSKPWQPPLNGIKEKHQDTAATEKKNIFSNESQRSDKSDVMNGGRSEIVKHSLDKPAKLNSVSKMSGNSQDYNDMSSLTGSLTSTKIKLLPRNSVQKPPRARKIAKKEPPPARLPSLSKPNQTVNNKSTERSSTARQSQGHATHRRSSTRIDATEPRSKPKTNVSNIGTCNPIIQQQPIVNHNNCSPTDVDQGICYCNRCQLVPADCGMMPSFRIPILAPNCYAPNAIINYGPYQAQLASTLMKNNNGTPPNNCDHVISRIPLPCPSNRQAPAMPCVKTSDDEEDNMRIRNTNKYKTKREK